MTDVVLVLAAIVLVVVVALLAAGRLGELPDAPSDGAPLDLPHADMTPEHVEGLRLGIAFRGYRMDEVDAVLDRVVEALAARDARIADLQARLDGSTIVDMDTPMPLTTPETTS